MHFNVLETVYIHLVLTNYAGSRDIIPELLLASRMKNETYFSACSGSLVSRLILLVSLIFIPAFSFAQGEIIKTYYDNAHQYLKEYYTVKDLKSRMINGEYRSYNVDGKLIVLGTYENNIPDGIWTYYYDNGNIKMRGKMKGDNSYGLWRYYYENGKPSMEGELKKGVREGKWKFYFESGLIKSEGQFTNGEKSGIWNYYYEDGILKAQAFYTGRRATYKEFYTSGNVKMRGFQLDGKSDSLWIYYYENGTEQAKGHYLNGLKEGQWTLYNEDGGLSAQGFYLNGEKNGKWTYYHKNGMVSSEGDEANGKKEGYWKLYNSQGQFIADGKFESGSGEYKEYFPNGNLKVKGQITDGKNSGKWMYYYEDGSIEGECDFNQGDGTYTGYYPSGKVKMKGAIKDNKNVGDWELFEETGELTGYYKPVYEDEKPVFKVIDNNKKPDTLAHDNIKPEYFYRNRKIRYYTPVINEYRGFILSTNPFGAVVYSLPVSAEYYCQERLGHEIQIDIRRNPFFGSDKSVAPYKLYKRGFDIAFRQKLYSRDKGFGMFYIANELRYTSIEHLINAVDSISLPTVRYNEVTASEQKFEYSFMVGNRWMQLLGEWMIREKKQRGITLDAYIGLGIGYRLFEKNYLPDPYYDQLFSKLNQAKFSLTPRLGLNLGYVF
jgi:uncharacterized protein